jgi:hypothetical protein
MTDLSTLRQATEDDVERALKDANFTGWPNDEAALLEFYHRMLDVLAGEGAGTDD